MKYAEEPPGAMSGGEGADASCSRSGEWATLVLTLNFKVSQDPNQINDHMQRKRS